MATQEPQQCEINFYGLGIAPKLLEALEKLKFVQPTPIQQKAIPIAVQGKDVIGIAQTGTGKTLAFAIPMIQRLAQTGGRGLIILPTRELAIQVEESLMQIGRAVGLRSAVLIGGASMPMQLQMIRRKPHVIIATPGRLVDHLEQRTIQLTDIKVLVLDEADRMLDMGFAPQLKKILERIPRDRQTMLFSATMPTEIVKIATAHMQLPIRVEVARAGTAAELVEQELIMVSKSDKMRLLEKLLNDVRGPVLVFSRTKHGAKKIARDLRAMGQRAAEIHANRSLAQRREALDGFKSGKYRVLVATDIAARGIDVKGIELVINFDLPDAAEDYIHRIGRTGRAGNSGRAVSFATPDQGADIRAIERLVRMTLKRTVPKELPPPRKSAPMPMEDRHAPRNTYLPDGKAGQQKRNANQHTYHAARRTDHASRDAYQATRTGGQHPSASHQKTGFVGTFRPASASPYAATPHQDTRMQTSRRPRGGRPVRRRWG